MSQATKSDNLDQAMRQKMANAIRVLSMDAVQAANSGHPGMPMGMADVATVLFADHMKFDASDPQWPDRDRFVLSAGHGSMLIYSLLYLTGVDGVSLDDIKNFRQLGRPTAGHPEYGHAPGIETTTGPLGQGISTAVGMALGERIHNAKYGDDVSDHYTYVIAGDGCLMEGISQEAISLAGHLKLNKLIVLWDDNDITIDGAVDLSCRDDQLKRFEASNWHTIAINGHDMDAIGAALTKAKTSDKPTLIACKTIIGKGAPNKQGTSATHGAPLGDEEIALTRKELGWDHGPFDIPDDILDAWRTVGSRGQDTHKAWDKTASSKLDAAQRAQLVEPVTEEIKAALGGKVKEIKTSFVADGKKLATRQSSKIVLDGLCPLIPGVLGGSADLTGSNGTKTDHYKSVTAANYDGNYIHYGIREHGMGAAMNGLALHGGFLPYSGTFLVFADYCRPAIRLSALMGKRVVYVMTHDSIGLGEDGPTHQPVEHLASLRAMPNLNVFRPADSVECAECWGVAMTTDKTPSIMTLTRQGLTVLRDGSDDGENLSSKGAYVLRDVDGDRDATILATGSEVEIAVAAAEQLASAGIKAAVVSMPCWELFEQQSSDYQWKVLGDAPRVGVEAAVEQGWSKWLGSNGQFVGMNSFGASGPIDDLYKHFGITAEKVAEAVKRVTGNS